MTYSPTHSFDIRLAQEHSIEEAIIVQHFQHWIRVNRKMKKHFHDGRTWSYQTLEWISAHFPYLSIKQIERIVKKLTDKKILIKGNYNKTKYDRTVWYAFYDESLFLGNDDSQGLKSEKEPQVVDTEHFPISGNGYDGIGRPIPDIEPYIEAKKKSLSKDRDKEKSASASSPPEKIVYIDKPRQDTVEVRENLHLTREELAKILEWNEEDEEISKAMLDKIDWIHQTIHEGASRRKKPYTISVFKAPWLRQAAAEAVNRPQKENIITKIKRYFKHGCIYNGAEYTEEEKGCGFTRGMNHCQVYWSSRELEKDFYGMLSRFGIQIGTEPQDVRKHDKNFDTMNIIKDAARQSRSSLC